MCLCFLKGKINESLKNIGLEKIWKNFFGKKLIFLTIFYIFLKLFINKYTVNKTFFF